MCLLKCLLCLLKLSVGEDVIFSGFCQIHSLRPQCHDVLPRTAIILYPNGFFPFLPQTVSRFRQEIFSSVGLVRLDILPELLLAASRTYPVHPHSTDHASMLGQRRRRWPNIEAWSVYSGAAHTAGVCSVMTSLQRPNSNLISAGVPEVPSSATPSNNALICSLSTLYQAK